MDGGAVNRIRIDCPLCDWHYEQPPLDPRLSDETLAGVFGPGIMLRAAINDQARTTETALRAHLSSHKLEEWVGKVTSLQTELRLLKASFS